MLPFETGPETLNLPPMLFFGIVLLIVAWTITVKGVALWRAVLNGQKGWFVAILVLNTFGILELAYLLAFRKDKQSFVAPAPAPAPSSADKVPEA